MQADRRHNAPRWSKSPRLPRARSWNWIAAIALVLAAGSVRPARAQPSPAMRARDNAREHTRGQGYERGQSGPRRHGLVRRLLTAAAERTPGVKHILAKYRAVRTKLAPKTGVGKVVHHIVSTTMRLALSPPFKIASELFHEGPHQLMQPFLILPNLVLHPLRRHKAEKKAQARQEQIRSSHEGLNAGLEDLGNHVEELEANRRDVQAPGTEARAETRANRALEGINRLLAGMKEQWDGLAGMALQEQGAQ